MRICRWRHRRFWVIGTLVKWTNTKLFWCPDCGAIREEDWQKWIYPKGHEKALKKLEFLERVAIRKISARRMA